MAIFSGIAAAIGGVVSAVSGFIGGLGAIGSFVLQTAAGIGLNLLAKAISGEQTPEKPGFSVKGKLQAAGDLPRSFIFGRGATAGSLVYANTWGNDGKTPNAFLTQVIALSDLPVGGLDQVWVNGELCTLDTSSQTSRGYPVTEYRKDGKDHLWVKFYDGTQTSADPFLVNKFSASPRPWRSSRVGTGVAYVITTARVNEELFTGFPKFKFALNGLKLYDPSRDSSVGGSGTQRWNDPSTWGGDGDHLPAVQIYNLLRGIQYNGEWFYGLQRMSAARLPDAAWIEQINKCRAQIQGPDGQEATYRSGGEVDISANIADAIEAILTSAQGKLAEIGGSYKIHVGAPDTPSFAVSDGHILSTEEQTFTPFFGLADTVNGIAATYPNPSEGWVAKSAPPLYRSDLEALAGNRRLMADVPLDLVPYKGQVQRLMKSALLEAQRARRHTLSLPPQFWTVEPGDYLQWTSERNGYTDKLFRVDGVVDKANLDVVVDITEVDPSDYNWDQGTDYKEPIDGPVGPIRPAPQQMTGWQVQPYTVLDASGKARRPAIEVFFDGDLDDVEFAHIQVRLAADGVLVLDGDHPYGEPDSETKSVVVSGESIMPNQVYEVRGRYKPYGDRPTDWSSWLSVTTPNVKLGPDDVDYGDIEEAVDEFTRWTSWNTREELEEAIANAALDVEDEETGFEDKQELRRELVSTTGNLENRVEARIEEVFTVLTGEQQALAQKLTQIEVTLEEDVASAVELLQTEISQVGDEVTANAQLIQQLETEVGNVAASVTIRGQAESSPGGGWARYGVDVRAGSGDDWSQGAFYIDVNGNQSRVVFIADQFVITDGTNIHNAFVFQSGVATLNVANIGTVTAGLVRGSSNNMRIELDNDRILISD